jgi:hypothetical protein
MVRVGNDVEVQLACVRQHSHAERDVALDHADAIPDLLVFAAGLSAALEELGAGRPPPDVV